MHTAPRLIIHAGFPKCSSSSIQAALARRHADLKRRSVYLFDRDLSINFPSAEPLLHPRAIARAIYSTSGKVQQLVPRLSQELKRLAEKRPGATAILSAEVLGLPGPQYLFEGIDDHVPTTLVFYVRPQFDWIPSAWKQWSLKSGMSLHDYLDDCLAGNSPPFLRGIESWARLAPKAKIVVRILDHAVAENGSPAADFFKLIGIEDQPRDLDGGQVNPSLDYALPHVLNKNSSLFRDQQDSELIDWLTETIPEQYLRTNIDMLSFDDQSRIAAHFFNENMQILETYIAPSAGGIYDTYFKPRATGKVYADMPEPEMMQRCLGILLATLPKLSAQKRTVRRPVIRPPYWKIPRRIMRRLSGKG